MNGCGTTSLAMVAVGLIGDNTFSFAKTPSSIEQFHSKCYNYPIRKQKSGS